MTVRKSLFSRSLLLAAAAVLVFSFAPGVWAKPVANPCDLLSPAEVGAALGTQVKKGEFKDSGNPLGQKMCFFPVKDMKPGRFYYAQISLVATSGMKPKMQKSGYSAKRLFQDTQGMLGKIQHIKGLGCPAYYGQGGLYLLCGEYFINLKAKAGSDAKDQGAAKALAKKVSTKLK